MKKVISLILFAVLLFAGCQDDNSILGPNDDITESHSPKGRIITPSYISLPDDGSFAKLSEDGAYWYVTQYVGGNSNLVIEDTYEGGIHGAVKVYANLSISEEAIDDEGYATLDISRDYGIVSFGPSELFESYATLDLMFVGVDLSDVAEPTSS
ncbi:MAG: hypothetical protein R3250_05980, partial [Melioribacteraceae bacterium]|nr:hypothetical protein [Melioribacteraceae bacterium]